MAQDLLELVGRAKARDAEAFASLIERCERTALAIAYGQLQDGHRAADAVQEAFLKAWQELPRLQEPQRFAGWLMQIVRNVAIDQRRRIRPTVAEFPDLAGGEAGPGEALEAEERSRRVKEALATLDDVTRTTVVMRYYEGLSAREIGDAVGLSPAAVDMRLSRARGQLKGLLAPLLEPADESSDEARVIPLPKAVGDRP